jgi:hypothetical protein
VLPICKANIPLNTLLGTFVTVLKRPPGIPITRYPAVWYRETSGVKVSAILKAAVYYVCTRTARSDGCRKQYNKPTGNVSHEGTPLKNSARDLSPWRARAPSARDDVLIGGVICISLPSANSAMRNVRVLITAAIAIRQFRNADCSVLTPLSRMLWATASGSVKISYRG